MTIERTTSTSVCKAFSTVIILLETVLHEMNNKLSQDKLQIITVLYYDLDRNLKSLTKSNQLKLSNSLCNQIIRYKKGLRK